MKIPKSLDKAISYLLAAPFVIAMIVYGSTKPPPAPQTGRFIFDARYLVDGGSYLSNDVAHVAVAKTVSIIPDDTPVLVYARQVGSTNVENWVQLLPQRTIAQHPADYALANATNYDVSVTADYVPPSPVITNLLFEAGCKIIKGNIPSSSLPLVVPRSILEATP